MVKATLRVPPAPQTRPPLAGPPPKAVTPQKDVPVVNVEETAGGTTASAPPPPLYVLPRTSTPLAGKGVKMTAASICVHGNQAERCEVCDAGGTPVLGVRGAAEYEDANSLTASGPMAIFKPQLAYVKPLKFDK